MFTIACKPKQEEKLPLVASNKTGEELAKIHCASCHSFPEPSALPKEIWLKNVLPKMALRFGYGDYMKEMLSHPTEEMMRITESGVFTNNPTIAKEDWEKIVKYYSEKAPEVLPVNKKIKLENIKEFEVETTVISDKQIVMTKFDDLSKQILVGVAEQNKLISIDDKGKIISTQNFSSPIVDIQNSKILGKLYLEVGKLDPYDLAFGKLKTSNKELLTKLHRPVNLLLADLNEDGIEDFVISNFGNLFGNLTWYDGKTLKENLLLNDPGARVVYHVDFDNDGKKDLVVLMTQAKESIVFFKNTGKGEFEMKNILNFPPYFGSSYFELKDIDSDKDLDIIYTNGDNADLSIVPKPYHGLRIYLNDGKQNFKENYFYPMNGASKVCSEDFDSDGDLDLAVISFFSYSDPSFLYFNNTGNLKFSSFTINNISKEKWLTMDAADIDSDGDKDLVLGSFNRGYSQNKKSKIGSVIYLKNKLIKK